jgi:hypothetical protein
VTATWLVEVTYGRIGSPGRTIRCVAGDPTEARRIIRRHLRRRATAPWRIGVGYHIRELNDPRNGYQLPSSRTLGLPDGTPAESDCTIDTMSTDKLNRT